MNRAHTTQASRWFIKGLASVLLTGVSAGSTLLAADTKEPPTDQQWQMANVATVEGYVIPRYQQLYQQATDFAQATRAFCDDPNQQTLQLAQQGFHNTMDAWQGIQHIRTGPIETLSRNYSMQFWPDKKNHVGKRLKKLIDSKDVATLQGDAFFQVPVSVRGLPALERILFDSDVLEQMKADSYRCQVSMRIADYVVQMGEGVLNEWQQQMLGHYQSAGDLDAYFEDNLEAAVSLLKPLIEQLEIVRDLKIQRPMGSELARAKFKRLESWRSQRSLRNLQLNLDALEQMYQGDHNADPEIASFRMLLAEREHQQILDQFKLIKQHLDDFNGPLEQQIQTPEGYQRLTQVADSISELHRQLEAAMAANEIFLGFNSRDGD